MRLRTFAATGIAAALVSASAAAQEPVSPATSESTCNHAYEEGDLLMHAPSSDHLLEARELLRVCAGPSCKDWMIKECATQLALVETKIPSVVFDITDETGNALVDVTVTTGSRVLVTKNDGHALELNPGAYPLVFTLPDGRRLERTVVLHEGVKGRSVNVSFTRPGVAPPVIPPLRVVTTPPNEPRPVPSGSWPLSIVGFSVAGAGAILGTITGIASLNRVSTLDSRCGETKTTCPTSLAGTADDARTFGTISTISFIASGAGLVLGFLMLPRGPVTIGVGPGSVGAAGRF